MSDCYVFFFFQAEDGIRDYKVTGVQTCALPIYHAKKFGAEIVTDMVESVRKGEDGVFAVRTARGRVYRAPTVILTAGGTPGKLGGSGGKGDAGEGGSDCGGGGGAVFQGGGLAGIDREGGVEG